ncbi:MAG: hypothetical protein ACXV5H_00600 [Halobacteriota archaeon]
MNPEIDLYHLVDEFLSLEKFVDDSRQFESVVAAPSLSDGRLLLEQDWQRFVIYKYNKAGVQDGLQDAMRDGYFLLLDRLKAVAQQAGIDVSESNSE